MFNFQAQGVSLPEAGEKRPRPGTRVRPKKKKAGEKPEEQGEHRSQDFETKLRSKENKSIRKELYGKTIFESRRMETFDLEE